MAAVKWQIVGHQETAMTSFPFPSTALRPWQLLYMYAESNGNQHKLAERFRCLGCTPRCTAS